MSRVNTLLLGISFILGLCQPALAQDEWKLPHEQSRPLTTPDAAARQELMNRIVDDMIVKKQTGFFSDKHIILTTRRQFDLDADAKARLKAAGFADDVIQDIEAKGKWRHASGKQPLKGTTISEPDSLYHTLVTANNDDILRAELRDQWPGLCHIDFINQTDHVVDLHYLAFDDETRNVNYVSDLRFNDEDPMSSNVFYPQRRSSTGRFGQALTNFYHVRLYPHPQNTDLSRYDVWKEEYTFVGSSSAFNDPKWKTQPPNPGSIRRTGPHQYHYLIHTDDPLDNPPMTIDSFYCYSYRDEMDNLKTRCSELKGVCEGGGEQKPQLTLGLDATLKVNGPEFELARLPFDLPRDIGGEGLGAGNYKTGLVTYKMDKDKAGKEHIFVYAIDTDPNHNPQEKFYVSLTLYPQGDDLRGSYPIMNDSDNQFATGFLISEFHFSNKDRIRNSKVSKLDIRQGQVDIYAVDDIGIYGTITLDADYVFKLTPDYSDTDECVEGLEDEEACNPEYQIRLVDTSFGAKKR